MSNLARILFAVATAATLVLLALLISSTAWLWLLLAATVALYFHARTRVYALLVVGALLTGAAVGILLEVALGWSGAFLASLGAAGITSRPWRSDRGTGR